MADEVATPADTGDQLGVQRLLDIVRAINGLTNSLVAGFARLDAPFVTYAVSSALTSSRVLTNSTSIAFTTSIAGQVTAAVVLSNNYSWSGTHGWTTSLTTANATAIPGGGTAGVGYKFSSTSNFGMFFGSGVPTLSAAKGSLYLRSNGTTTNDRAYINTNGTTGWTALTTAA